MVNLNNEFILDNGGYSMKVGFASSNESHIIPNCVSKVKSERRRLFIADQIEECKDYSALFYILPITKGYISNYDVQRKVWDFVLKNRFELKELDEKRILCTQPYFNFKQEQHNLYEIMFEEYGFGSMYSGNPSCFALPSLTQAQPDQVTCLVVDSGYSYTHIIPYIYGEKIKSGIVRIDVGGKALTNYLKDVISYRQLHVLDETFVMNQCKEDCCYVSLDLNNDLEKCSQRKNSITRDYVLPDFANIKRGFVKEANDGKVTQDMQIVKMNNERIQVPEILFYPSDVNISQIGISHAIYYCIEKLPEEYRPILYQNIYLMGGNCCFPNFRERIQNDVRGLADHLFDVKVMLAKQPITEAWKGAQCLVQSHEQYSLSRTVTRKEYNETGLQKCMDIFEI